MKVRYLGFRHGRTYLIDACDVNRKDGKGNGSVGGRLVCLLKVKE